MAFKIGDRVKTEYGTGKIIADPVSDSPGVEHDENIKGHSCQGKGKGGYCYWISKGDIKKISRGRSRKGKQVKFIAIYDETDRDPYKTFISRKELVDWIKEAQEDKDVVFDSIRVFGVDREIEIEIKKSVTLRAK